MANSYDEILGSILDIFVTIARQDGGACGFCYNRIESLDDIYYMFFGEDLLIGCDSCSNLVSVVRTFQCQDPPKISLKEVGLVRSFLKRPSFEKELEKFLQQHRASK